MSTAVRAGEPLPPMSTTERSGPDDTGSLRSGRMTRLASFGEAVGVITILQRAAAFKVEQRWVVLDLSISLPCNLQVAGCMELCV